MTFKAKRIDFKSCVRIACMRKGVTLSDASRKAGRISGWLLSQAGRASPTYRTITEVCDALGVGFVELLSMDTKDFTCKNIKSREIDFNLCARVAMRKKGLTLERTSAIAGKAKWWMSGTLGRSRPSLRIMYIIADVLEMELIELLTICEK